MRETNEASFIGYEYRDITTRREMASVYVDGYQNFGWEMDSTTATADGTNLTTIKLKRNRKIRNKAELTRLQRQFDACMEEIIRMERSKPLEASITAFTIGIVGTAFLAGATFAYLGGMLPLMILLAIPGFVGWVLPYFCYQTVYAKKNARLVPLIEKKYDELYDVCERANGLLSNDEKEGEVS